MKKYSLKNNVLKLSIAAIAGIGSVTIASTPAVAQIDMAQKPVLVITNKPMPASAPPPMAPPAVYARPSRVPEISPAQIAAQAYVPAGATVVGRKIDGLNKDLFALQGTVGRLTEQLRGIEQRGQNVAADYYASVATINTQLQTGTTPGNPRLVGKLNMAQASLETLNQNIANLNTLAVEIADAASRGSYLLETVRSTYNLSGAIEEDHARLAQMEDQINNAIVTIDRLLNDVNDDISRTTTYLTTERNNIRTLSLAVSNGDLYGKSLANHPFSRAPQSTLLQNANFGGAAQMPTQPMAAPPPTGGPARPLAKIRFDKPNVDYEQPIYAAIQNAMQRYPNARFELIAVHPTGGNAAQVAIESTRSRRNAERVLRTLTQMGIPLEQIDLSYAPSSEARTSEVHLFLR